MISEIFLIRTRAKQVVPVFENFMNIYPSLDEFLIFDLDNVE
ncbi:unnamed protein product, partial [marine sediment metagenome]